MAAAGVQRVAEFNRRTLDGLAARLYFYYSLAHERTGTLAEIRRSAGACCRRLHRRSFTSPDAAVVGLYQSCCWGGSRSHTPQAVVRVDLRWYCHASLPG